MTFEKDSTLISKWDNLIYSSIYSLHSTVDGYILSTISKVASFSPIMTRCNLKVLNRDLIKLSSYKDQDDMLYDSARKSWIPPLGGQKMYDFFELKRIK